MRGKSAVNEARADLRAALRDESPSVRVVAALALGQQGTAADLALALPVLKELAPPDKNGVYVSLEALTAVETLGDKAAALRQSLRRMSRADPNAVKRVSNYVPRLLQHLLREEASGALNPTARPERKHRDR